MPEFSPQELDEVRSKPYFAPRPRPLTIPSPAWDDDPLVCLAVNASWITHIIGALEVLDQLDAWEGAASDVEDARQQVREIIAALITSDCVSMSDLSDAIQELIDCCNAQAAAMTELIACCQVQTTVAKDQHDAANADLVDTYGANPITIGENLPDTSYTEDTGDAPEMLDIRKAALCAAIKGMIDAVLDATIEYCERITDLTLVYFGSFLDEILGFELEVWGALADEVLQYTLTGADDRKELACVIYANLESGDPNDASDFQNALVGDFGFTPTQLVMQLVVQNAMQSFPNFLRFLKYLDKATGAVTKHPEDFSNDGCDCTEDIFDFTWASETLEGWASTDGTIYEADASKDHIIVLSSDGAYYSFLDGWGLAAGGENSVPNRRFGAYVQWGDVHQVDTIFIRLKGTGFGVGMTIYFQFWDADDNFIGQDSWNITAPDGVKELTRYPNSGSGFAGVKTVTLTMNNMWAIGVDRITFTVS